MTWCSCPGHIRVHGTSLSSYHSHADSSHVSLTLPLMKAVNSHNPHQTRQRALRPQRSTLLFAMALAMGVIDRPAQHKGQDA
eukprot:3352571-Amphidinium_carterae.2